MRGNGVGKPLLKGFLEYPVYYYIGYCKNFLSLLIFGKYPSKYCEELRDTREYLIFLQDLLNDMI